MSRNKSWVVSDTHFGHKGVCEFLNYDGTKMRPWDDVQQMDEDMIQMWNDVVAPNDRVYHLGDVVINRKALPILAKLNGKKVLVKGNHDIFTLKDYLPYFEDIRAYLVKQNIVFSHIPIHPSSMERFRMNVHGHLHANRVLLPDGSIDPKYLCVCVEQTGYKPIAIEEIYAYADKHFPKPTKEV